MGVWEKRCKLFGSQKKEGAPKEDFVELAAFEVGHGDWTKFLKGELKWGSTFQLNGTG